MQDCVISCRVSSREQTEGYSLESQKRLLTGEASNLGFEVARMFEVAESASKTEERKTFQEMMRYVKKHNIKHILVEKVDRITRSLQDAVTIDDWRNIEGNFVHFVKDGLVLHKDSKSSDILQWDIKVVFARQYINNLREEVRKGVIEKALHGHYPGNLKRGYKSVRKNGSKRAVWKIDKSKKSDAPFIKRAFELYAYDDLSLVGLRQKLFSEGWKTKHGRPIQKSRLAEILQDPFYAGEKFLWNGKEYSDAVHEGLVQPHVFDLVQLKFNRNRNGVKRTKHRHLLAGIMKCGVCGRAITAEIQKGHTYYRCTGHGGCEQKKVYTREEDIEVQLVNALGKLEVEDVEFFDWLKDALREVHQEESTYHEEALGNLKAQYDHLQKRVEHLYEDKLDRELDPARYRELSTKYRAEQEVILEKINGHHEGNKKFFELGEKLVDFANQAKKMYEEKGKLQKREILRFAFLNLQMKDKKLEFALHPTISWIQNTTSASRSHFGCGNRI